MKVADPFEGWPHLGVLACALFAEADELVALPDPRGGVLADGFVLWLCFQAVASDDGHEDDVEGDESGGDSVTHGRLSTATMWVLRPFLPSLHLPLERGKVGHDGLRHRVEATEPAPDLAEGAGRVNTIVVPRW